MIDYLFIFGCGCLGYLLPEFTVALGGGTGRFPHFANWVSVAGCVSVGAYSAFGA